MQPYRILRDRLISTLDQRWNGGLGVILGGPGMGKSTLLAQAVAESSTLGRGEEWLVRCQRDWTASSLHRALRHALVLPIDDGGSSVEASANEVAEFLWSRAPKPAGLVIDDVQNLDSSGLEYLLSLQQLAPGNAHVLVASREHPTVTATLMTADPSFVLDGGALLFDGDELRTFAESANIELEDLATAGGWPAVVALTASAGPDVAGAYLYQRVLAGLSREQQGDLAVAAVLGETERELCQQVLRGPVTSLASLPLVEVSAQGSLIVHDLWREPLAGLASPDRIVSAVRATAQYAHRNGDADRAVAVLVANGLDLDARTVMLHHIAGGADRVPLARIDRWLATISSPEQALLRQVLQLLRTGLVSGHIDGKSLDVVSERCRQASQLDLVAVLAEVRFAAAWSADDVDLCLSLTEELQALAEAGVELAAHAPHTREITRARHEGNPQRVIELLRQNTAVFGDEESLSRYLSLELETLVSLGLPFEALERLEGLDDRLAASKVRSVTYGLTYWFAGRPEDALRSLDALLMDEGRFHGIERSWITTAELFRRWRGIETVLPLDIADDPEESLSTYSRVCEGLCQVGRLIDLGQDEEAAKAIADLAARLPPTGGFTLTAWFMGVAAWYVLREEDRPMLDAFMTENLFLESNKLLRSLVVALETGRTPVRDVDQWPSAAQIGTILPNRWAATLALGLPASHHALQGEILRGLEGQGVPSLERLASATQPALAAAAVEVLAARPRRPQHVVRVHLLGAPLLDVPHKPESAEWRRGRVRSLLGLLALRGRTGRETLIEDLWPDLDVAAGRRNLRVTLSYLTKAIEPDRAQHAPAWFIRSDQDVIELFTDGLELDILVFEEAIEQARIDQQRGLASKAIESLRLGCSAYAGSFLEGLDDDWIVEARGRYQLEAAAACNRLSSLFVAGNDDEAVLWAERSLEIDPFGYEGYESLVAAMSLRGPAETQAAQARYDAFLASLE